MALTAATRIPKLSSPAREIPLWAAGLLTVAGNILVLGIVAAAAAGVVAAAVLTFGSAFLAQL